MPPCVVLFGEDHSGDRSTHVLELWQIKKKELMGREFSKAGHRAR
jgi:hypothetical protein